MVATGRLLPCALLTQLPARAILASDGLLLRASEAAYGEGITGLVQVAGQRQA